MNRSSLMHNVYEFTIFKQVGNVKPRVLRSSKRRANNDSTTFRAPVGFNHLCWGFGFLSTGAVGSSDPVPRQNLEAHLKSTRCKRGCVTCYFCPAGAVMGQDEVFGRHRSRLETAWTCAF